MIGVTHIFTRSSWTWHSTAELDNVELQGWPFKVTCITKATHLDVVARPFVSLILSASIHLYMYPCVVHMVDSGTVYMGL